MNQNSVTGLVCKAYPAGLPETRPCPSYPALCVLPEPGGTRRFPRPLLIKPDRTFNEIIQGLLGDGKPFRAEVIAQEIESSLGFAYQGLMLYYLYYHSVGIFWQKQKLTFGSLLLSGRLKDSPVFVS